MIRNAREVTFENLSRMLTRDQRAIDALSTRIRMPPQPKMVEVPVRK